MRAPPPASTRIGGALRETATPGAHANPIMALTDGNGAVTSAGLNIEHFVGGSERLGWQRGSKRRRLLSHKRSREREIAQTLVVTTNLGQERRGKKSNPAADAGRRGPSRPRQKRGLDGRTQEHGTTSDPISASYFLPGDEAADLLPSSPRFFLFRGLTWGGGGGGRSSVMEGSRSKDARDLGFGRSTSSPALLPQQQPPFPSPHPITPKPAWSQQQLPPRARLQLWFIRVCTGILVWSCVVQLLTVGQIWHRPHLSSVGGIWDPHRLFGEITGRFTQLSMENQAPTSAPAPILPARVYKSNGFLKVSCNGGLNQMRAAICDMVMIAHFLNLTLVIPELDKKSFWADPSNFRDIFDVRHFIDSLRDEVRIISELPKRLIKDGANGTLSMPPVSWSNENYYLKQILPLFDKYELVHFNKTDARLANNGIPIELQKLRCQVNYHALKFTEQIEKLGNKLIQILRAKGRFVALHLRYEMDMLAFSGCTHGCSKEEAELLKTMRFVAQLLLNFVYECEMHI
ncbi:hypothetical protein Taro_019540 [Colocasia esculenta]|uniref:O-fucosyltransferase family protein n=1 Tax=Colocasia esculenta TaxID=4460 RepID=A0A843ULC0_COLES|nr:hypothetical protein [Colocasia esculenta]